MGSNVDRAGSAANVVSHSGAVGAYTSALLGRGGGQSWGLGSFFQAGLGHSLISSRAWGN